MISALRSKLTYANVVATFALFIALGGSSYAAVTLSKNSVKSKHIAPGAVKRSDIGANAVNSAKVADASLLAGDFAPGQLPSGPKGENGAKGDQGEQGLTGETGSPGLSGVETVSTVGGINSTQDTKFNGASCPTGKRAIAGGGSVVDLTGTFGTELTGSTRGTLVESRPNGPSGWWATAVERVDSPWGLRVYVICANVDP